MTPSRYIAREQARWMQSNAARFIRPDAARFLKPGTKLEDIYPALALKYSPNQPRVPAGQNGGGQWTSGNSSGRPRVIIDTTNWDSEASGRGSTEGSGDGVDSNPGFDAPGAYSDRDLAFDTPMGSSVADDGSVSVRDPQSISEDASKRDGTADEDRPFDTRLASNEDKPRLGQNSRVAIFAEIGRRLVRTFRSENGLFDLFNHDTGTVAHTQIGDLDIFGSNSTSPTYTSKDRQAADRMREVLIDKYPNTLKVDDIGQKPNDALYHAETNVLLRSARENGGTLAGRSIEIYVDRPFCNSCQEVIPLVGLELGNPEMTIVDPRRVFSIANGKIKSQRPR